MTRINVSVPPKELSDRHLIAEHRELKRIPNAIRSGRAVIENIPAKFTLGKGHVKFFYDKLLFLRNRYELLYEECINRGFKVTYYGNAWADIPVRLMNDYLPTAEDDIIIRERINERTQNPRALMK
jgi:deoxyribonuclease (pyrimidine dimer)